MINPELVELFEKMDANPEAAAGLAVDDRRRAALVDVIATLTADQVIGLADTINKRIDEAGPDPSEDRILAELVLLGWSTAIESLRERYRQQHGEANDVD
ncbi:MAG: hypothetical protein KTR15_08585 [Phycisphaeraceae bacterium]|nr:hypothetical protein [Phycisphaeraceae bacterium]